MPRHSAHRILLIHWHPEEARDLAAAVRQQGFSADPASGGGTEALRGIRAHPPDAIVISLDRLPSHGREVAIVLRQGKSTRHIPIVFAGGLAEKVQAIRALLPDAVHASWESVGPALRRAIANPPTAPVKTQAMMERYTATPLVKKLEIKPGMTVLLLGAPDGIEELLGDLPDEATLRRGRRGPCGLILWFTRSLDEFERELPFLADLGAPLWVIHPKKSSGVATDLNQNRIRERAPSSGLVDCKICAVDETWTGLLLRRRRQ